MIDVEMANDVLIIGGSPSGPFQTDFCVRPFIAGELMMSTH